MRGVVVALFVICALSFHDAAAHPGGPWIDATGSWSIDFSAQGWGRNDDSDPRGMMIQPLNGATDEEFRLCILEQTPLEGADAARDWSAADLAQEVPTFGNARTWTMNIDGHAVGAAMARYDKSEVRGRAWITRGRNVVYLTTLSCWFAPRLSSNFVAEVEAILHSLHFTARDIANEDITLPCQCVAFSAQTVFV